MKPVIITALALLSLSAPAAHAGLGDIINTTYLVLCQPASKEGKAALERMPLDQQVDVKRGRDELITFLANSEDELAAFKAGPLSSKEKAAAAGNERLKLEFNHFVNTCGMTLLLEKGLAQRGCVNEAGTNLYKPEISAACAPLFEAIDDVLPSGFNPRD